MCKARGLPWTWRAKAGDHWPRGCPRGWRELGVFGDEVIHAVTFSRTRQEGKDHISQYFRGLNLHLFYIKKKLHQSVKMKGWEKMVLSPETWRSRRPQSCFTSCMLNMWSACGQHRRVATQTSKTCLQCLQCRPDDRKKTVQSHTKPYKAQLPAASPHRRRCLMASHKYYLCQMTTPASGRNRQNQAKASNLRLSWTIADDVANCSPENMRVPWGPAPEFQIRFQGVVIHSDPEMLQWWARQFFWVRCSSNQKKQSDNIW